MIGRLTTGTIGLGRLQVKGRNLDPSPPAMMMAFKLSPLCEDHYPALNSEKRLLASTVKFPPNFYFSGS
jgi:hypothetical protein